MFRSSIAAAAASLIVAGCQMAPVTEAPPASSVHSPTQSVVAGIDPVPDWFEVLISEELRCLSDDAVLRMRARDDGSVWTQHNAGTPQEGTFTILPDGSGWQRSFPNIGTEAFSIVRDGDAIVIEGELGIWRCTPV